MVRLKSLNKEEIPEPSERYVSRCVFCPLGKEDDRGIKERTEHKKKNVYEQGWGWTDKVVPEISYHCGLNPPQEECTVLAIYRTSKRAEEIAENAERSSARIY